MRPKVLVGVSGFSYPAWKGRFYPKDVRNEDLLVSYAERFDTVEINSSFYGAPRPATVSHWAEKTGEGFVFSFKAPRLITHMMKLGSGSTEAAESFSKSLGALGPRLGPVLFQLPPFLKRDEKALGRFLEGTETIKDRVFEFRDRSWLVQDTYSLLEGHGAGFCIAETEDLEPQLQVTSSVAYFRLRKDAYDGKAMDRWAGVIGRTAKSSDNCYVYLRHDETGENALLAGRLSEKLNH